MTSNQVRSPEPPLPRDAVELAQVASHRATEIRAQHHEFFTAAREVCLTTGISEAQLARVLAHLTAVQNLYSWHHIYAYIEVLKQGSADTQLIPVVRPDPASVPQGAHHA